MTSISIQINPPVTAKQICDLRVSVGWIGLESDYPAVLAGYWATLGVFTPDNKLIGWCALISDGVRHAVLLDVIIHPQWQRQRLGKRLVQMALDYSLAQGITIVHVDFTAENTAFYQACGFKIGLGGIYTA